MARYDDNQSTARLLAEDAADLCARLTRGNGAEGAPWTPEVIALAQAKALTSIALALSFPLAALEKEMTDASRR